MARPRKDGVDYFPFDVDFFSDNKIKIVRSRYGSDGIAIYIYLLCEIYRDKGYYLQCNEDTDCLVAAELGMSTDKVGQIKAYLLGRSLFDDTLFRSAEVLSSKGIQRRFQQAVKGRAAKNPVVVREDLWLLDEEETESFIKVRRKDGFSENNPDNSKNNPGISGNKTTNQSKVNQSKVKHSKSSAPARAEMVASLPDDDCDDPDKMIIKAVERDILGKETTSYQYKQIEDILRWYPHNTVFAAIKKAKAAGGKSVDYLKKVCQSLEETWTQPKGMYVSSISSAEIEDMLNEEFYSELEDWDE